MEDYFKFASIELINRLAQIKVYIKKHNSTIGILTEEILRDFLRNHLPKKVSVEQGFILTEKGEISKQCDVIIYNSHDYSPFYRINDIVVVPEESVLAIIEVKTTINKSIFHDTINYFESISNITNAHTYLFIYNSNDVWAIGDYFKSYKHKGDYQEFDHDTFQTLPDEITGLNKSYHLKKDAIITDGDYIGYTSYFFEGSDGTEINALYHFFSSIHELVKKHTENTKESTNRKQKIIWPSKILAIPLFNM